MMFIGALLLAIMASLSAAAAVALFRIRDCPTCGGCGLTESFEQCRACNGKGILFRPWWDQ